MPVYRVLLMLSATVALTGCTNLENGLGRTFAPTTALSSAPPPPVPPPPPPFETADLLLPEPLDEVPQQAVTRTPDNLYNVKAETSKPAVKAATASSGSATTAKAVTKASGTANALSKAKVSPAPSKAQATKEDVALPAPPKAAKSAASTDPAPSVDVDTALLAQPVRKGSSESQSYRSQNSGSSKSPQSSLPKKKPASINSGDDSVDILPISNPVQDEPVNYRNFS